MKLLVTGGSGFLGGFVLRAAADRGHTCIALARSQAAAARVSAAGAQPLRGDLADAGRLTAAFADADCDALVNLASLGFGHAAGIVTAAERAGIRRCRVRLDDCRDHQPPRAVKASTTRRGAAHP